MNLLLVGRLDADERAQWRDELRRALPHDRLVEDLAEVGAQHIEVALVAHPPPGTLAGLPRLKLIQSLWAGVDRLLADATLPPEVPLARMVDPAMTEAMAQTALWAVLSLNRRFFDYAAAQGQALWRQWPQRGAGDSRVLVLGFGEMGRAVALRLKSQGYPVAAWRRSAPPDEGLEPSAREAGIVTTAGRATLASALAAADIVINLLPLTGDTRGMIDAAFLAALPPGAALVNLARGAHVVEADLLAALASGRLSHAVLDVFATEPLPADHAFWRDPRVTVLPHVAALTDPRSAVAVVAANVEALRHGRPLSHRVDRARGY